MPRQRPVFLDTNIFLRQLRNDHSQWSPACQQLFRDIEAGKRTAWTTDLAIAEVVYVLESKKHYDQERSAIAEALRALLSLRHLKLNHKKRYERIFTLYTTFPQLSYVDCYHAALVEAEGTDLYSYDTDFDLIGTIVRKVPALPD
jgi:predicted nucleic acid-binding protein